MIEVSGCPEPAAARCDPLHLKTPPSNIVRFPTTRRKLSTAGRNAHPATSLGESHDHGPSTDESLRLMRAFVRIKNRHLRADLITMLEGASAGAGRRRRAVRNSGLDFRDRGTGGEASGDTCAARPMRTLPAPRGAAAGLVS
jgi:hypothetical protein